MKLNKATMQIPVLLITTLVLLILYFKQPWQLYGERAWQNPLENNNWFLSWLTEICQSIDSHGIFNVWTGLPQGFTLVFYGIWTLLRNQTILTSLFWLAWRIIISICEIVIVSMVFCIANMLHGKSTALKVTILYAITWSSLNWFILNPIVYDPIPLAFLFASIYFFLKKKRVFSAVFTGVGLTLKPFVAIMLPLMGVTKSLTTKQKMLCIGSVGFVTSSILMPFFIGNPPIFFSWYNWQTGRPPWQTVYSFALWAADVSYPIPAKDSAFMDASGVQPSSWIWSGITPQVSQMTTPVPPYSRWYGTLTALLFLSLIGIFYLKREVKTEKDVVYSLLFVISSLFLVSYGWSPQYLSWVIPLTLLCFPKKGCWLIIVLEILVYLEYPIFYAPVINAVLSVDGTSVPGLIEVSGYWATILLRTSLLGLLAYTSFKVCSKRTAPESIPILGKIFQLKTPSNEQPIKNKTYYMKRERYDWVGIADKFAGIESIYHRARERTMDGLVEKYGKNGYCLDVGCGAGLILRNLPPGAIGLDINRWVLGKAKMYAPKAQLVLGDAEYMPFKENAFSTIIFSETLEHFERDGEVVKEIHNILNKGGVVIGSTPRESFLWRLRFLSATCPHNEPFHNQYKEKRIGKIFSAFGPLTFEHPALLRLLNIYFIAPKAKNIFVLHRTSTHL